MLIDQAIPVTGSLEIGPSGNWVIGDLRLTSFVIRNLLSSSSSPLPRPITEAGEYVVRKLGDFATRFFRPTASSSITRFLSIRSRHIGHFRITPLFSSNHPGRCFSSKTCPLFSGTHPGHPSFLTSFCPLRPTLGKPTKCVCLKPALRNLEQGLLTTEHEPLGIGCCWFPAGFSGQPRRGHNQLYNVYR
jgi:hypothetical protein